jgi:hypothetical protein
VFSSSKQLKSNASGLAIAGAAERSRKTPNGTMAADSLRASRAAPAPLLRIAWLTSLLVRL